MISVITDLQYRVIKVKGVHTYHGSDGDEIRLNQLKEKIRNRVLSERTSLRVIYDQEMAK